MGAKKVLTKTQLQQALTKLPDWHTNPKATFLKATFAQPDYISGLVTIARIVVYAELAQHHPDISYTYNNVQVKLTTHDSGGITQNDIALATKISALLNTSNT